MKRKILYCLNFIWAGLIAFSFPLCFEIIYLCITGHSKGYDYDLGPEKDISIMFGCVGLLIWLAIALPSNIYVLRKTLNKGKVFLLIPAVLYVMLAVICVITVYGGWLPYAKEVFNL